MRALIGNTLLKKIEPRDKPFEIRDTRLTGFLLRVQPSGVATFYVEYGRGQRYRLGRADAVKPDAARTRAKQILADAYHGRDPMAEKRKAKSHTFRSFIEEAYRPWAEANIRTSANTIGRLKANFPDLQNKKLADITPWLVEKWRAARLKSGTKPSTVNRDLDDLRSSLGKAVAWGLLDSHPLGSVKRSRVDTKAAVRFLSDDEETRLREALGAREERIRAERDSANRWRHERGYGLLQDLRACAFADYLTPMVLLSLHTGLRRGEVFNLKWPDVDLDRANLTVHGTGAKSQQTRHVPLNEEALAVLKGWRDQTKGDGLVFPGKNGERFNNIRRSWSSVLEVAEISVFRWHDLRHTFASRLVMAGVDLNTVRELLGHSDYAMTLRYAHLAPEHKAAAVARLVRQP
jgi:integrase